MVWEVPFNGGAMITSYRVSWNRSDTDSSDGAGEEDVMAPATKLVIGQGASEPLQANTEYQIEVRAQNSAGLSEASTLAVSTLGLPLPVPLRLRAETIAETSIRVVWDALPDSFDFNFYLLDWFQIPPRADGAAGRMRVFPDESTEVVITDVR